MGIKMSGRYLSHFYIFYIFPSFILGSAKRGVIHSLWYHGAQLCCVPLGHAVIMVCRAWYAAGISLVLLYGGRPQIM